MLKLDMSTIIDTMAEVSKLTKIAETTVMVKITKFVFGQDSYRQFKLQDCGNYILETLLLFIKEIAKVTKIAEMESMPEITEMVTFVKIVESWQKGLKQAGAELGQAQLKLRLDFNQIQFTFGFSLFDLVELVSWALYFKLD